MKALGWAAAILVTIAQAAEAGPPARRTLLENDKVVVVEVAFAPGDEETEHTHGADLVGIAVTEGFVESTAPDGKAERLGGQVGDVFFLPRGSTHRAKNTTGWRVVFRVVQLK